MGVASMEMKKLDDPKLNNNDIAAVANSRFFRKSGLRMLMLLAIVILAIAMVKNYVPRFPDLAYYACLGVAGISFTWLYSKRQAEIRVALFHAIDAQQKARQEKKDESGTN